MLRAQKKNVAIAMESLLSFNEDVSRDYGYNHSTADK